MLNFRRPRVIYAGSRSLQCPQPSHTTLPTLTLSELPDCVPYRSGFPIPPDRGFTEECRRQSAVVAEADRADRDLTDFVDRCLALFLGYA